MEVNNRVSHNHILKHLRRWCLFSCYYIVNIFTGRVQSVCLSLVDGYDGQISSVLDQET